MWTDNMTDIIKTDDEIRFAYEYYLATHPFIEAYANGHCQPFHPYGLIAFEAGVNWARKNSIRKEETL